MHNRGVSPLVATLILIAISALLGFAVMSFGKSYIEERAEFVSGSPDCGTINLLNTPNAICQESSRLRLFVEASPQIGVQAAQIRVVGSDNIYESETFLSQPLQKGQSRKVEVNFGNIGTVSLVKITPYQGSGAGKEYCRAFETTSIPSC